MLYLVIKNITNNINFKNNIQLKIIKIYHLSLIIIFIYLR